MPMGMQCRGTGGEHTDAGGGRVDISNQQRIGKSEVELVQVMVDGVCQLIELEKKAEAGTDIKADVQRIMAGAKSRLEGGRSRGNGAGRVCR